MLYFQSHNIITTQRQHNKKKNNFHFKDLFPDIDCPTVGNPEFTAAVQLVLDKEGYVAMSDQVTKFFFFKFSKDRYEDKWFFLWQTFKSHSLEGFF